MGNEQGHNCFTPRQYRQKYNSDVIANRRKVGDLLEPQIKKPFEVKNNNHISTVENNEGDITIKIKINFQQNSEENVQKIVQIPIKIEKFKSQNFNEKSSASSLSGIKSTQKESQETRNPLENGPNILDIDLPETTTRRGTCQWESLSN